MGILTDTNMRSNADGSGLPEKVSIQPDLEGWTHKAFLNESGSGKLSSDRTCVEYAAGISKVAPGAVS